MNNPFEFMNNMMNQGNAFNNPMNNFKGFEAMDFSSVSDMIKKNSEAVASANQMVAESFQSIAKRGSDNFQKNATEMFNSVREAVSAGDMEQLNKSSQKYWKQAIENNINNTKEILDVASKSSMEILDVVGKNMTENINQASKKKK